MKTKQGREVGSRAQDIMDAVADRNMLVHARFLYQCDRCGEIEPIYLGVGVEGPKELRDDGLYIASPYGGPQCPTCRKGRTKHVRWNEDQHFDPMPAPEGALCFIIPPEGVDVRYFGSSVFAGKTIRA